MNLYTSAQIKEIDKFTIENKPISSINLMENAAIELFFKLTADFNYLKEKFIIICGPGNNGGDGLALSRKLLECKIDVVTVFCNFTQSQSIDGKTNLERLKAIPNSNIYEISDTNQLPDFETRIIIDCIFGTGLTRSVSGIFAEIIEKINNCPNTVIAVDIPSGLFGEDNSDNTGAIIRAHKTYTIGYLPVSSMFSENYQYFGDVSLVEIGLCKDAEELLETPYFLISNEFVSKFRRKRKRFEHKGNFGHSLLIAGSYTKAGAAVLAAKSCLKCGTGLLTVHVPKKIVEIIQATIPEAMISADKDEFAFSSIDVVEKYDVIGVGPGIGTDDKTINVFEKLLKSFDGPLVIDADGLNILALNKDLINRLNPGTILTPHPKEFERLFGTFSSTFKAVEFMQEFSQKTGIVVVRKDGITAISDAKGNIYFNDRGNPGMATGGSGDVLTGMILSLLAQGYKPENAAISAVFLHSISADLAVIESCFESLSPSDIISFIPAAFNTLESDI